MKDAFRGAVVAPVFNDPTVDHSINFEGHVTGVSSSEPQLVERTGKS